MKFYFDCNHCGQYETSWENFSRFITPALGKKLAAAADAHHAVLSFGDHGCPKCLLQNQTHEREVDLHVFREPSPS